MPTIQPPNAMPLADAGGAATTGLALFSGVPQQFELATDRAEFRRPRHLDGVELYRAHIVRHAFDAHTHEAFGIGVVEAGVERFRYAGAEHLAGQGEIVLMNPDVLHTGQAETSQGWRYRMLYIDPVLAGQLLGQPDWSFGNAVCSGQQQRAAGIAALIGELWQAPDSLAFDCALFAILDLARPLGRERREPALSGTPRFGPVLDYMQAMLDRRITLAELAGVAGLSPSHFLRSFQKHYHVTPQQMLMACRLYRAKQLLAAGQPLAGVAAATGLCDQAHLTHAFVRRYGLTPARYQQQIAG